jgi:hypothetical protein
VLPIDHESILLELFVKNAAQTNQDECRSVLSPVCTDSANAHGGLNKALELSVHTGGAFDGKVMIVEG